MIRYISGRWLVESFSRFEKNENGKKSVPVFDGRMNGAFATKNSLLLCCSKHFFPLKPENKETAYVKSSS